MDRKGRESYLSEEEEEDQEKCELESRAKQGGPNTLTGSEGKRTIPFTKLKFLRPTNKHEMDRQ